MKTLGLSARSGIARPSPTLAITARANALKASGIDIISFGAGEPDFNTPEPICDAAINAIRAGFTKYTPSSGIKDLKEAVATKLERENDVLVSPDQIVVSCGAKHSLYNSAQMIIDPGDEVILIAPYWMTYYDQVRLALGIPVVVHTEAANDFVPDLEALRAALTPKTKAIFINSPCNPTGAVYPRETLEGIARLAVANDLWIIADEIYERLVYGEKHVSIASLGRDIADRTITIGGCSKTYAMTGWRIGFSACPLPVAKAMSNFQDQVTSNPTSFAQKAAIAALHLSDNEISKMCTEFEIRHELAGRELRNIPGLRVPTPKGAFYYFLDASSFLGGRIPDDVALAEFLLEEANVALVPGSVFEGPGFLRLSYTASQTDIQRGIQRIGNALSRLHP